MKQNTRCLASHIAFAGAKAPEEEAVLAIADRMAERAGIPGEDWRLNKRKLTRRSWMVYMQKYVIGIDAGGTKVAYGLYTHVAGRWWTGFSIRPIAAMDGPDFFRDSYQIDSHA